MTGRTKHAVIEDKHKSDGSWIIHLETSFGQAQTRQIKRLNARLQRTTPERQLAFLRLQARLDAGRTYQFIGFQDGALLTETDDTLTMFVVDVPQLSTFATDEIHQENWECLSDGKPYAVMEWSFERTHGVESATSHTITTFSNVLVVRFKFWKAAQGNPLKIDPAYIPALREMVERVSPRTDGRVASSVTPQGWKDAEARVLRGMSDARARYYKRSTTPQLASIESMLRHRRFQEGVVDCVLSIARHVALRYLEPRIEVQRTSADVTILHLTSVDMTSVGSETLRYVQRRILEANSVGLIEVFFMADPGTEIVPRGGGGGAGDSGGSSVGGFLASWLPRLPGLGIDTASEQPPSTPALTPLLSPRSPAVGPGRTPATPFLQSPQANATAGLHLPFQEGTAVYEHFANLRERHIPSAFPFLCVIVITDKSYRTQQTKRINLLLARDDGAVGEDEDEGGSSATSVVEQTQQEVMFSSLKSPGAVYRAAPSVQSTPSPAFHNGSGSKQGRKRARQEDDESDADSDAEGEDSALSKAETAALAKLLLKSKGKRVRSE